MTHLVRQTYRFSTLFLLAGSLVFNGCKKDDDNPTKPNADFTYTADYTGRTVTFTKNGNDSYPDAAWNFGDGETATGASVTHTFTKSGKFSVKLEQKNGGESITGTKEIELKEKVVQITTDQGEILLYLYNETPKHKNNFLKLANQNYFDGTTFHRVIKDFMIQGGDPNSKDSNPNNDGQGGPGYTIDAEIIPGLLHDQGAVGAARTNNPQKASSGSQFYIVEAANGAHHLDNNYTVFGMALKGKDVVTKIAMVPKDANDRPLTDVKMTVKLLDKTVEEIKSEYGYTVRP